MKVTQLCPTLCDPMDYIVHEVLQAGILEWVAIPSPGDRPNPGIELRSPTLQADSLPAEPQGLLNIPQTHYWVANCSLLTTNYYFDFAFFLLEILH